MRGDTEQQLRNAINPHVTAHDPKAAHYLGVAKCGSALDLARQTYADRDMLEPIEVLPSISFSKPEVIARWRKGAEVPSELRDEFAGWLQNVTARGKAISENERRLRASMSAQRTLAQSEQECDRRTASAFGRWHIEHWGVADVPRWAPAGQDQPFEEQLTAAVRRHVR